LLRRGRISRQEYDKYLALATGLHLAGYQQTRVFKLAELEEDLRFAEELHAKAKSIVRK